jgi:hypothetical protein
MRPDSLFSVSSTRIAVAVCAVVVTVGCGAPVNDYVTTAYMLRFGEEQRRATGRTVGEVVVPSDAQRAARLAIPTPDNDRVVLERLSEDASAPAAQNLSPSLVAPPATPDAVAVDLDRARLVEYLKTAHEVAVVDAQTLNGRLVGGKNILRVEFVPKARSDESLLREFALVCASVLGMDKHRTVDTVLLLAIDARFLPWMSMKSEMSDFEKYQSDAISLKEWRRNIETVRY